MKEKMKKIVKGMAVTAIAVSVIFGSVTTPVKAEAKGTAFINKKVSSVTPTIKSAKRSKGKVTVTVSVPTSKVKKLGKARKITVAYGSTKNSKKFEAKKLQAKVTKKGKNQYTFTVNNKKLASYKNAYITVRFDGKSNWSKLVKVSGKATKPSYKMPKRDKDGTYTKSILKRFDWTYNGCVLHTCNHTLGTMDDGDGWIYVTVQCTECKGCGELIYDFVMANADARDCTAHAGHGNKVGYVCAIAFDKKTGKVVAGNDFVLEKYPVGTFFMEVE